MAEHDRRQQTGESAHGINTTKVATILAILLLASVAFSVAFAMTRSTLDAGTGHGETETTEERKEQKPPAPDDGEGGEEPVDDDGEEAAPPQVFDEEQGSSEEREAEEMPEDTERIASGQADDGTYILSGTVRVHEELFVPMSRIDRVASLVLDEGMPYESEYKGTVYDLVAHDVLLATTGSESFGADRFDEWARYDGRHIVIRCESVGELIHDGSYWKADAFVGGETRLLDVSE